VHQGGLVLAWDLFLFRIYVFLCQLNLLPASPFFAQQFNIVNNLPSIPNPVACGPRGTYRRAAQGPILAQETSPLRTRYVVAGHNHSDFGNSVHIHKKEGASKKDLTNLHSRMSRPRCTGFVYKKSALCFITYNIGLLNEVGGKIV
jgi:hypothetical protein